MAERASPNACNSEAAVVRPTGCWPPAGVRLQRPRARVYKGLRSPVRAGRPRVLLASVHRTGTIATAHAALSGRIGTIAPAAIAVADSLRFLVAWHVAGARAGGSASAHSCTSIRLRFASFRDWMQCTKMPPNASRVQRLQPQRHMWYCIAPPGFLLLGTCRTAVPWVRGRGARACTLPLPSCHGKRIGL